MSAPGCEGVVSTRPPPPAYAELQVTTNFSFLRGASHADELVAQAKALGLAAIAVTDRNTLAGVVRAHTAAKEAGLRLVVGARLDLADGPSLLCLPKDRAAYGRLSRLISLGQGRAEKGQCHLTLADVAAHAEGQILIALPPDTWDWRSVLADTSCESFVTADAGPVDSRRTGAGARSRADRPLIGAGEVCGNFPVRATSADSGGNAARRQCAGDMDADQSFDDVDRSTSRSERGAPPSPSPRLRGEGSFAAALVHIRTALPADTPFHLALTRGYHGEDRARLGALSRIADALNIPTVATNDVLYHAAHRRPLQDVLTCIREGTTIGQAGLRLEANAERHLKAPAEMARIFSGFEDALARTLAIVQQCTFSLDELVYEYPEEPTPPGKTPQGYLEEITWEGAAWRFPQGLTDKVRATIEKELRLIEELSFAPYFLTVYDIVTFARSNGILCQGRGSAANSAVCYCLGITAVNPVEVDLLFERFVSHARKEPPDIDVDFEHERREEVIQYIYARYGRERAGLAATVISYRARSAVRDVGKAMGLSEDTVAALAGMVWGTRSGGVLGAKRIREAGLDPSDPLLAAVMALTEELIGFPRHLSQHVGGFVLTRGPLVEVVPVGNAAMADRTFIEWDKDDLAALGLLKIDVLALGMLTCIHRAFDLLEEHHDLPISLASVPREDGGVYDMLCRADSLGVFQVESRAQMNMLPRLKPRCFYDLVIEVAIVRPGPIQGDMVHPYLRRRDRLEPEIYPAPSPAHGPADELRQILGRTKGVPLFQEQAMRIAMDAAKFSDGEVNELRKAMATFRRRGTIGLLEKKMVSQMVARGYDPEFAARCFAQIKGFGEYGFPESHAASFAHLVYVSSWLKCHYPAAFACALLNSQPMGFYAPAQIVRDAREHGVVALDVDVNYSDWDCSLESVDSRCESIVAAGVVPVEDRRTAGGPRSRPEREALSFSGDSGCESIVAAGVVPVEDRRTAGGPRSRPEREALSFSGDSGCESIVAADVVPVEDRRTAGGPQSRPEREALSFSGDSGCESIVAAGAVPVEDRRTAGGPRSRPEREGLSFSGDSGCESIVAAGVVPVEDRRTAGGPRSRPEREGLSFSGDSGCESIVAADVVPVEDRRTAGGPRSRVDRPLVGSGEECGSYAVHATRAGPGGKAFRRQCAGGMGADPSFDDVDCSASRSERAAPGASGSGGKQTAQRVQGLAARVGEKNPIPQPALRLGFRQIDGLRQEEAERLVAARIEGGPFRDVHDLKRRARISPATFERLAAADAFRSMGHDRRQALWEVKGLAPAGDLPLFAWSAAKEEGTEPDVALPEMPLSEHVVNDYQTLRLSLKAHPMRFLREDLAAQRITPCAGLRGMKDGAFVRVAGVVLVRQRPGSAKGVVFMTIEDETGVANTVVWPNALEKFRKVVMAARLIVVAGRIQRHQDIIHVVSQTLEDRSDWLARLADEGPDMRVPIANADEVLRPDPGSARGAAAHPRWAGHPRNERIIPKSRDFH